MKDPPPLSPRASQLIAPILQTGSIRERGGTARHPVARAGRLGVTNGRSASACAPGECWLQAEAEVGTFDVVLLVNSSVEVASEPGLLKGVEAADHFVGVEPVEVAASRLDVGFKSLSEGLTNCLPSLFGLGERDPCFLQGSGPGPVSHGDAGRATSFGAGPLERRGGPG